MAGGDIGLYEFGCTGGRPLKFQRPNRASLNRHGTPKLPSFQVCNWLPEYVTRVGSPAQKLMFPYTKAEWLSAQGPKQETKTPESAGCECGCPARLQKDRTCK